MGRPPPGDGDEDAGPLQRREHSGDPAGRDEDVGVEVDDVAMNAR